MESIQDLHGLPELSAASTAKVKAAAVEGARAATSDGAAPAPAVAPGEHPGVERWPVKTGTDLDVASVGQNTVKGEKLGAGVVATTVEELIALPRPANMPALHSSFPKNSFYQNHRAPSSETTVWKITATITEAKLEQDGDYHLVLKGDSGKTMIGEIPNPEAAFVKNADWRAQIKEARDAMDQKLGRSLKALDFAPEEMAPPTEDRFAAGPVEEEEAVMTKIGSKATITGVGFFDSSHGQTGVAPNAIELHPIFSITFH
ncbi:MAG: hypothetical protein LAO79_10530 [Acidobacteriia bacterium]|nr:hypothetical protein [Terriglobia bacterium]